jgi:hypothetical protein
MTSKWEDVTSYSKGERGVISPKVWRVKSGPLTVIVVSGYIYNPDFWVVSCHALGMDAVNTKLPATYSATLAQKVALNLVRFELEMLSKSLAKLSPGVPESE